MAAVSDLKRLANQPNEIDWAEEERKATHDRFEDIEEVRELIASLENVWNDLRGSEMACERFTCETFQSLMIFSSVLIIWKIFKILK